MCNPHCTQSKEPIYSLVALHHFRFVVQFSILFPIISSFENFSRMHHQIIHLLTFYTHLHPTNTQERTSARIQCEWNGQSCPSSRNRSFPRCFQKQMFGFRVARRSNLLIPRDIPLYRMGYLRHFKFK